jgi:hypothetical protein
LGKLTVAVGDVPLLKLVEDPEAKTRKPTRPDSGNNVYAVFKHYWHAHLHPMRQPKPASKTWRAIAARLRDGWSIEELCMAVDGYHLDPWHQGKNDEGKQHLELELSMRDDEHVTRGIEWAENPPKASAGSKPARDIRVGHVRAEDYDHSGPVGEIKL